MNIIKKKNCRILQAEFLIGLNEKNIINIIMKS